MIPNYVQLKRFSPMALFKNYFAILDSPEHYADNLFIEKHVHVDFYEHFVHPGSNYEIILCSIDKCRTDDFIEAMDKLHNKMILLRKLDYEDACKDFISLALGDDYLEEILNDQ